MDIAAMFFVEGMDVKDIQSSFQCTEESVLTILYDARQRVFKRFSDQNVSKCKNIDAVVSEICAKKKDIGLENEAIKYLVCDMLKTIGGCEDCVVDVEEERVTKHWDCIKLKNKENAGDGKIKLSQRELNKLIVAVEKLAKLPLAAADNNDPGAAADNGDMTMNPEEATSNTTEEGTADKLQGATTSKPAETTTNTAQGRRDQHQKLKPLPPLINSGALGAPLNTSAEATADKPEDANANKPEVATVNNKPEAPANTSEEDTVEVKEVASKQEAPAFQQKVQDKHDEASNLTNPGTGSADVDQEVMQDGKSGQH